MSSSRPAATSRPGPGCAPATTSPPGSASTERRKGNQHLNPILVEAAWSAIRTDGRLRARYHRLVLRFGGYRNPAAKKRAIVAIAHTLIVIIWHMLTTGAPYTDLGPDFYARRTDPDQEARRLISRLEALGRKVTIEPAA